MNDHNCNVGKSGLCDDLCTQYQYLIYCDIPTHLDAKDFKALLKNRLAQEKILKMY